MKDIEKHIRLFALENAVKFKGKANPGAVIGKLLALDSSIKSQMKEVQPKLQAIIKEINALPLELQKKELLSLDPDYTHKQTAQKLARKQEG
jgi:glutamyl-tRNA synthetase